MTHAVGGALPTFLLAVVVLSFGYTVATLLMVVFHRDAPIPNRGFSPPVTILKPLCGLEPELLECLRSFFEQDYEDYQIVFGVRAADDPALAVLERLRQEYPHRSFSLVVDGRLHGLNRKMSNLTNMVDAARHDIFVISDSDVRVGPTYLRRTVAPFASPEVACVTSLYTGIAVGGLPAVLGSMFIDDWFLPAALASVALSKLSFCFGQTMAVRRDVLEEIGGFRGLAPYLADDYMLGKLVRDSGRDVLLVEAGVENVISESTFAALFRRELRWFRTYRTARPIGYSFTFLTDTAALALLYLLASGGSVLGFSLLGAAVAVRLAEHLAVRRRFRAAGRSSLWLIPIRDILSFVVRVGSFLGRRVQWKGEAFVVQPSGRLVARQEATDGVLP